MICIKEIFKKIKYLLIILLMTMFVWFIMFIIRFRPLTNNPTFLLWLNGIKQSDIILDINGEYEKLCLFKTDKKEKSEIGMVYLSHFTDKWKVIEIQKQKLLEENVFLRSMRLDSISLDKIDTIHTILCGKIKNNRIIKLNGSTINDFDQEIINKEYIYFLHDINDTVVGVRTERNE